MPVDPGSVEEKVIRTYLSIVPCEAANAHRRWPPACAAGYAPCLRTNIEAVHWLSAGGCSGALERRKPRQGRIARALADVAAVKTPTRPTAPPPSATGADHIDGQEMSVPPIHGRFTMPCSVAGCPALSLPAGLSPCGLPTGFRFSARPGPKPGSLQSLFLSRKPTRTAYGIRSPVERARATGGLPRDQRRVAGQVEYLQITSVQPCIRSESRSSNGERRLNPMSGHLLVKVSRPTVPGSSLSGSGHRKTRTRIPRGHEETAK